MIADTILINDWHPVAHLDEFDEKPILSVRLLGEDLVLWRVGEQYLAWQDLCVHRGTRLSLGKIVDENLLMCPYHGWTYDQEGRCVRIPAHPEQKPPAKAKVKRYQTKTRYGLLWVCLGEPANEIPPFPEDATPGFVTAVCDPARHVSANGPRLIENFLDAAHFPYVHEGVLGDPNHPEIPDYQARIGPDGVESDPILVYQPAPYASQAGVVEYVYHAYRPLTAHFSKKTGEKVFGLMLVITPHDERDSTGWFIVADLVHRRRSGAGRQRGAESIVLAAHPQDFRGRPYHRGVATARTPPARLAGRTAPALRPRGHRLPLVAEAAWRAVWGGVGEIRGWRLMNVQRYLRTGW